MPKHIQLEFKTYEDEGGAKKLEAKAIDIRTAQPVASLPLSAMHEWLRTQGFHWLEASSGIWTRD